MIFRDDATRAGRRSPSSVRSMIERAVIDTLESRTMLANVTASTPYNGQQNVSLTANLTVTFGTAMLSNTLTSNNVYLTDPSGNALPSALSYNSTTRVLTINPDANLATTNNYYTLTVAGGPTGVKDSLNGPLDGDYTVNFTTGTPSFSESTIFSNLINPTAIEFAADGRVFVAEKRGVIKVFDNINDTTPDIFADLRTQVHNYWDRGLLGMTLDPQFTTGRPFVYVLYTFDGDIGGTAPKWGTPNTDSDPGNSNGSTTVAGRLSKLTASGNQMTGGEQVLITDWQNQFPSHSIGDLKFGPDGYLYASAGDGASFNAVDYGQYNNPFNDPANEGGALRSQDMLSPGDSQTLDGTVIRINPDTGAGAPANPYASSSDANAKRIIATGLRNPYRFTFRPGTSEIWIAETGWNAYEEINRIVNSSDAVAENFGWPAYEGPNRQSGYDAANLPLLEAYYNGGRHDLPWYAYSHSEKVVPGSSEPTGGSSPTGILFYTGDAFPQAYKDAMFFTDYSRKQIYVMYRGVDGLPSQGSRQVFRALGSGAVDLKMGPDGAIYYADLNGNRIVRIAFTGATASNTTKLTGTVIGTPGSSSTTGPDRAFDGQTTSFFIANTANNAWAGLDLGSPRWVKQIKYSPRNNYQAQMVGGKFQGSNDPSFATGVVDLFTITSAPANNQLATVSVNPQGQSFRYVRYVGPANSYAQVGEIEFYGGEGLAGTYYNNINFTGGTASETAPTINFNWGAGQPHVNIAGDTFSARWTGKIQAIESGTYTFRTTSDDGVRLWVNNVLLVDKWIDQSATSWSNTINLTAGQLYDIRVEYFENTGDALVRLEWQRPGKAFEVVPTQALYTAGPTSNTPPVPTINTPITNLGWKVGDTVSFSGGATDVQDGTLSASALTWTLVIMHDSLDNPGNPHEHIVQSFTGISSGTFIAPDHEYPSWLELRLTATDSQNVTTTVSRQVNPLNVQVTLASSVPGVPLTIGSATGSSPLTRTVIAGSINTISAPAQFVSNGITYTFAGWSDGGSPTHDIAAPATNTTYTATYSLPAAPAAPSGLTATSQSSTQINLSWVDNAGNETGYKIERRTGAGAWTQIATPAANATTYSDAGLAAGTTYEYRVRATGAGGDSAYSNVASATTASAVIAPAAPSGLVSTNLTTTSVTLTWTDNANNETGYRVERRVGTGAFQTLPNTLSANATTFTDSTLTPGTSYEFRVRAFNSAGDSAASNAVGVTTPSGNTTPIAPASLAAVVNAGPQVALTWEDRSSNETHFVIQRRYAAWIWGDVGAAPANATSFLDTTSIGNVTYEYRVIAVNALGSSDYSNGVLVNTAQTGPTPPATPGNLTAVAASSTRINLTWNDLASGETGYKIERRIAGGTWAEITIAAANATSYADLTVTAGNTYEYRVRATTGSLDGGYSNSATVTTPGGSTGIPNTPTGLTAAVTTRPNVQLAWTDTSNNETGFVIQRRYTGWIWGDVATVGANITSFLDTTGINNVTYEYRVVAISAGGSSPFSNSVIVSTE